MKFNETKQKSLVELVEELSLLTENAQQLNYKALKIGYTAGKGLHLNKDVYRAELNKYIIQYGGEYENNTN